LIQVNGCKTLNNPYFLIITILNALFLKVLALHKIMGLNAGILAKKKAPEQHDVQRPEFS